MFYILVYDIPTDNNGTKRRNAIYNLCVKHGYQYVFIGLKSEQMKMLTL